VAARAPPYQTPGQNPLDPSPPQKVAVTLHASVNFTIAQLSLTPSHTITD